MTTDPPTTSAEPDESGAEVACVACGGRRLRPLPAYSRAHLVRCRECGLVFAGRRPTQAELARNYAAYSRADYDSSITRRRYRELLDRFEPHRQTGRVLDVGCGVGFFLEEAREHGWDAWGTEFEPRAVDLVRAKGLRCVQAPLADGALEAGSFDVVTAFEVVEHLRDPLAEWQAVARALRPGGLLYCTTPNFASLSRRLLRARWSIVEYPEHLTYFTSSTLRRWLARFGFVEVKVQTTGFSPSRLQQGVGAASGAPSRPSDERLRASIEASPALRAAKGAVNGMLGLLGAGDTIKGTFELRA